MDHDTFIDIFLSFNTDMLIDLHEELIDKYSILGLFNDSRSENFINLISKHTMFEEIEDDDEEYLSD
jgi:hypothetical protein